MTIDQLQSILIVIVAAFCIAATLALHRAFDILDALADAARGQNEAIAALNAALADPTPDRAADAPDGTDGKEDR